MFVEYNLKSDRQYFQCRRGYECCKPGYVRRPIGLHSLILVSGAPESSPVPQATSSANPLATSTSVANTSNVGAIAGGVVGGVAFIGVVAGLIAFTILRCRKRSAPTPSTHTAYTSLQNLNMMSDGNNSTVPTMTSRKFYVSPAGHH